MSLPIDPVGSGKTKYKNKLKRDRSKAKKIYLPYYDEKEKVWKVFELPYFDIEVLEYGPREDHPVFTYIEYYPNKGMGAPSIGSGGSLPSEEDDGTGLGGPDGDSSSPGPGSGQPGTPLYPPEGEVGGPYAGVIPIDPITGEPTEEVINIDDIFEDLELEMLKPGKISTEEKYTFSSIGYEGPQTLLDWDLTLFNAMVRELGLKEIIEKKIKELEKRKEELKNDYENGNITKEKYEEEILIIDNAIKNYSKSKNILLHEEKKISSIEREDERYILPSIIFGEDKGATLIFIRDISGSITPNQLVTSKRLSKAIDYWVKKAYGERVKRIYILHNYDAWEVEERDYYGVKESVGGTRFSSAYEIVLNMLENNDYPRKTKEKKNINPAEEDIYIVQITDGFGQSDEEESKLLEKIIPLVTRFCYVQEFEAYGYEASYKSHLEEKFREYFEDEILRTTYLKGMEDQHIKEAMKDLFGKRK